ncbi:MAG: hypothetical protein LBC53_03875 [Spirochaetaceae bacterium]|jgi:hypothetical protein|nr:hypothetical protein [Spirochaetaceae bacterium]
MILLQRTSLIKFGLAFSLAAFAGILAISPKLIPLFESLTPQASQRAGSPARALFFKSTLDIVPYFSLLAALIFACIMLFCILYFFENTSSPEIHCFELFAFSFAFEIFRVVLPLKNIYMLSPFYLMTAERCLAFARLTGIFALFAAGLFASGIETKRKEIFLFPFCVAALIIAIRMPIDIYSFDTSLSSIFGFSKMFHAIEFVLAIITASSFFVGAYLTGSREYIPAGGGVVLLILGKTMLQTADALVLLIISILMIITGFYLFCNNLRKMYMWM